MIKTFILRNDETTNHEVAPIHRADVDDGCQYILPQGNVISSIVSNVTSSIVLKRN